jgi:hypothetical protein
MSNPINAAYTERNRLVALLASLYPSAVDHTAIDGWDPEWHNCVYIDFPWGQASWHFSNADAHLFEHLPRAEVKWDGHTTEAKYQAIWVGARQLQLAKLLSKYHVETK